MNHAQQNLFKLGAAYYPDYISNAPTLTRRVEGGQLEWLERDERLREDFKRMKWQGIHTIRMGEFSWATLEPSPGVWKPEIFLKALDLAVEFGIEVIFCTPTATPPKWLIDRHPDILPITRTGQRIPFGSRRHYDFHHPEYQKESRRISELYAKTFGHHHAITSWQTDNEFGCHNSVFLFTTHAKKAFHSWLSKKYKGEVEALNEDWFTCFWSQHYRSFDEIELPLASWADQNPHLELEFRRFSNAALCQFQRDQIEVIRKHSPQRPITHNLMTLFTDLCPWMASKDLDYVGFDHYQMETEPHPTTSAWQFALMRSAKQKPFTILEQQPLQVNWQPTNRRFSFDWLLLWGLQAAFQGANGMLYFSWQRMPGGCEQYHDGVVPHDVRIEKSQQEKLIEAKNKIFSSLGSSFQLENSLPMPARDVLCLFDSESLWSHEITSQSVNYTTRKQIDNITHFCQQHALGLWFTHALHAEQTSLQEYKLVVLPGHAFELSAQDRKLLADFRRKGGRVLSLPRTGYKLRNNKLSPLPAVFYADDDFYLEDYGALLENETEHFEYTPNKETISLEGHMWSEKIVIKNDNWKKLALFSPRSLFVGFPAALQLKESDAHGAHVHMATCPTPKKEVWNALRQWLELPVAARATSTDLQLQTLTDGRRIFISGVHFGHHPATVQLSPDQLCLRATSITLTNDLTECIVSIQPDAHNSITLPPRSVLFAEIKTR